MSGWQKLRHIKSVERAVVEAIIKSANQLEVARISTGLQSHSPHPISTKASQYHFDFVSFDHHSDAERRGHRKGFAE
jgi:hypothetical protein